MNKTAPRGKTTPWGPKSTLFAASKPLSYDQLNNSTNICSVYYAVTTVEWENHRHGQDKEMVSFHFHSMCFLSEARYVCFFSSNYYRILVYLVPRSRGTLRQSSLWPYTIETSDFVVKRQFCCLRQKKALIYREGTTTSIQRSKEGQFSFNDTSFLS